MKPTTGSTPAPRKSARWREWLLLALALLAGVAWLTAHDGLHRIDLLVQDAALRTRTIAPSQDIVILAIDDRSIEAIGRWPWRRALHAQLVNQVSAQEPRALGLDILFGEPDDDYPGDDLLLARAIEHGARTVLPVARRGQAGLAAADLPIAPLREAASQLGHVQVQVDADGITRSLFAEEGPASAPWPHFSAAMLCAAGRAAQTPCRGNALAPAQDAGPWVQRDEQRIPFAHSFGGAGFTTYAYLDALTGQLPADALRGKYVLVGATATGLGDMFATPVAGSDKRIAGVEVIAHSLNARLAGLQLHDAPGRWNTAINLGAVALALLAMLLLGPLAALLGCAALGLGLLAAALLAPALAGWQLAPAPALLGVAAAYPLWSWRRLSFAAHFLRLEMLALKPMDITPLPAPQQTPAAAPLALLPFDLLERRIHAVEEATQQLRRLHHFISDSLLHLPSPTLVCNAQGTVVLANTAAAQWFGHAQPAALQGKPAAELLQTLHASDTSAPLLPADAGQWGRLPAQQEGLDDAGRHLLMLCQPFATEGQTIWLLTLVDLTAMRQAQTQRDRALHFISHDIRAPIGSIVTLLEMQREWPASMTTEELLQRIEQHAQVSLAMAHDFVQLAHAQNLGADTMAPFDLAAAVQQAVDDAWAQARSRKVALHCAELPQSALMRGNRSLVLRAITNVLGNAIKFSPAGSQVSCSLNEQCDRWAIAISDQGPGIPADQRDRLFQPFARLHQASLPKAGGIGLGLALAHTVVQRHGGTIAVDSDGQCGTTFTLLLPRLEQQPGNIET